ncbi:MAG: hypothetical protein J0H29_13980 [Sphingobacteriales bacterium]|nr:hypothetical protein [Sphingobacteriales bacterium]OJY84377.1 MAG: hypothetical protein BGP14_19210 [Sphingobacteriales bacterium 44-15]
MKKRGVKIALIGVVVLAAVSAVVMLLWNWLMPVIFGLVPINFWQALGLFLLTRILSGRFGFLGSRMMMRERGNHLRGKWMNMTPEQRKEFINKRRNFRFDHPFGGEHFDMEGQAQQGDGGK